MIMIFALLIEFAVIIYSVILHEVAHGWVADRLGDPTARLARRLTLDPRPHIDLFMTILLPLFLYLSNFGIIFGAAKPVPIDPFNFRQPKKDTALTAAAGPLTNIFIAVILSLLFRLSLAFILNDTLLNMVAFIISEAIKINVLLALFNLLPIPPLDGSKVLAGILPDGLAEALLGLERFGLLFIVLILFLFGGLLSGIILPVSNTILRVLLP